MSVDYIEASVKQGWQEFQNAVNKKNNWYRNGRDVYQFVFKACVPAILLLFGLVGNGFSVAVLRRRTLSSATLLLITLAFVDSLVLIIGFVFEGFFQIAALGWVDTFTQSWYRFKIVYYLVGPFGTASEMFECCTMVILGVDR